MESQPNLAKIALELQHSPLFNLSVQSVEVFETLREVGGHSEPIS